MAKIADLHVTVTPRNAILVDGSIKGQPAKFLVDVGTNGTVFDGTVFSQFGIPHDGKQARLTSETGESNAIIRTVPDLKFGNFVGDNLHWYIADHHFLPDGVYALLAGDFLQSFDLDLDLAHNTIGLYQHNTCHSEPVYWSQSFSEADLIVRDNRIFVAVELNGTATEALFDSGSSRTIISTRMTHRLGFDETAPGMTQANAAHPGNFYTYRFSELKVGDEVIKNPLLYVRRSQVLKVDMRLSKTAQLAYDQRPDAYLGADFIKTHHIYLAPKDRKMYFTYNGGGIFSPPQDSSAAGREDK
jgi:predicted aspartyl protease